MQENITALVVSSHSEQIASLVWGLERLDVKVRMATSVAEANNLVMSPDAPLLIWAEVTLADGSWRDLLVQTQAADVPANVIVVSRQADVSLYVETINQGAFDFVVTPITLADLAYVLRSAVDNATSRRGTRLQPADPVNWQRNSSPKASTKTVQKPSAQRQPPMAYNSATE